MIKNLTQMGIKGFNPFLRKKCPGAYVDIPLSNFKGKKIALDSDNVFYKFMSRAHKEIVNKTDVSTMDLDREEIRTRWIFHVKTFITKLLTLGITPICVFDGKHIPEKSKTQGKRREAKQKIKDAAEEMKDRIRQIDELERTPSMITELRKKMQNLGYLTREDKDIIIKILRDVGIPVLKATGEGEQLCAMLCIEGKVDAVFSRDTDLVAFGCPITINEEGGYLYNPKTDKIEETYKCTIFKPVLYSLDMEYKTFVDLCIMAGCDFNDNIFRLGIGTAYKLLVNCKSIENLPEKYNEKVGCLKHLKCREIFNHPTSDEVCEHDIKLEIDTTIEILDEQEWLNEFKTLYFNMPSSNRVSIHQPPTYNRSSIKLNIVSGNSRPKLNIVSPNIQKKSSPKRINTKRINILSNNQCKRFQQRLNNS